MNGLRLNLFSALALGLLVPLTTGLPQTSSDMDEQFNRIAEEYIEEKLQASPVSATKLGDHRFDHLLDEVDAKARTLQVESAKKFLTALDGLEFGKLKKENQVDCSLLRQRLKRRIWEIEKLREWEWNPLIYSGLPGSSLYGLMSRDAVPLDERLKNAAARCREFPRFFDQTRTSLSPEKTPLLHAETAVGQNRGILNLIDALLRPHLDGLAADQKADLEEALTIARAAVEKHQQWLESELVPGAGGNPRLSEELFRQKFAFELFTDTPPEELRSRGERQVADLHDRMYELSKTIYRTREPDHEFPADPASEDRRKLIRTCLEFAYADAPERDGVVEAANHSLKITTDFVREKDLITLPEDPLEIIVMPEFRRGVALAYCDSPGPLEAGQKTFYAVAPPPEDWTDEQVDSHLREYNLRSIHNLTVHEAMPGHFVQLAHANRTSSELRAILASGTFIEGWAVYTEWMMVEEGFLADDPLMKLIVLKWYLRDVTNALIDQAVHLDGIDEAAAKAMLMEQAFQEEREAAGKFKRAQLTSAQLSTYFAGYLELVDLREAAEKARGDSFDLKTYHDRVLSFGSPPAAFVRALLLDQPVPEPK